VSTLEFNGNLNPTSYLYWIQSAKRIFRLENIMMRNPSKAIQKMKWHASLWYENLNRNRARKTNSKIKIWSMFKKHMDKEFLPSSYT